MKKIMTMLLCVFVLTSCAKTNTEVTVADYFPLLENTLYTYEGNGITYASNYTTYNGYARDNIIQRYTVNEVNPMMEIMQVAEGQLTFLYGDPAHYFFEDQTQSVPNVNMILLKEPLQVGQKWTAAQDVESEITSMDATVKTPTGDYVALEVTTTTTGGNVEKYYYAKDVGLVQSTYDTKEGHVVSSLASIKKEVSVDVPATFFIPNITANTVEQLERILPMKTNQDFVALFETELKKVPSEDYAKLLTDNTKIKSLTIDWQTSTMTLDLSGEFITESNVGDGIQSDILQSLANTVGRFYGTSKVAITVDGKPYAKGSIAYEPGETLSVEVAE